MRSLILLALLVIFLQCFQSAPVHDGYDGYDSRKVSRPLYDVRRTYGHEYDEKNDDVYRNRRDGYADVDVDDDDHDEDEDDEEYENNRIYKIKQIVRVNEDRDHHKAYPEKRPYAKRYDTKYHSDHY